MQITNNLNRSGIKVNLTKDISSESVNETLIKIDDSSGSGVKVNLIKGVSSEAIAEALIRINEQELNIIGYESQTKTYRDETSILRDNAQVSANNANTSATNANNSALLSTTKANEAILSANNALTYRNEAETFKTNAKVSEINADLRATAASTSEVNAKSSELLALQYKDTTLSLKDETLLLKNETVLNAITATEQATISTSNAIITEQQAQIATTKASESLVNANNAKASELLSAQYKADNESIKTNVQTLSNSAYDSANTASIKANEASDSAIVSTTQANISIVKASEASTYATNSNTSAVNALASENKAEEWASKEYGLEVESGLYSAKHYATESNNALISMNSSVNPLANTVVKRDNNSDILTRTLNTTIESTSDIATKYYVETNNDGYLRPKVLSDVRTEIAGDKVTKTGNETIAGVKTFSSSPIVPTPTSDTQVVNKVYVDGKYSGFKNYIINGNFDIWQRGTSFTGLRNGTYSADRWVVYDEANNINYNVTRNAGVFNTGYGATYSFNSGTAKRGVHQFIENVTRFKVGSNVTISFEAYTNSTPYTIAVVLQGVKGFWASTTGEVTSNIALTNTKTKYSVTLPIPDWTSLGIDWVHLEDTKLALKFMLGVETNGRDFILGSVQLEEGSVATPFEQRPYGLELSLCQRYYYAENYMPYNVGFVFNSTMLSVNVIKLPVAMRVVPTITPINPFHITTQGNWGIYGATNGWSSTGYTPNFSLMTNQYIAPQFNGVSGVTDRASYICSGWFSALAEL